MSIKRILSKTLFPLAFAAILAGSAAAKEITVDDNRAECKKADFTSIQAAVLSASPGDNIKVCPGTYREQVRITGKSNLTLFSEKPLQAVIKAPATAVSTTDYSLIRIEGGSQNVTLKAFTISGPLPDVLFCSDSLQSGVRVVDGSSATITDNYITEIRSASPALRGCQNGFAIAIGRQFESQSGSANVTKNVIDKYQKGGIYADGAGTSVSITNNTITGSAGTTDADVIAPNGVQVSRNATGSIKGNTITKNVYTPRTFSGSGIYIYSTGSISVSNNNVTRNDTGMYIDTETGGVADVQHNDFSFSTFDGLDVLGTYDNNGDPVAGTTGANVAHNTSSSNGWDGIYVDTASTNNTFEHNKMDNNALVFSPGYDAEDNSAGTGTGGTANIWFNNKCTTDNRGGALCR